MNTNFKESTSMFKKQLLLLLNYSGSQTNWKKIQMGAHHWFLMDSFMKPTNSSSKIFFLIIENWCFFDFETFTKWGSIDIFKNQIPTQQHWSQVMTWVVVNVLFDGNVCYFILTRLLNVWCIYKSVFEKYATSSSNIKTAKIWMLS